jgi:hypothetical protein
VKSAKGKKANMGKPAKGMKPPAVAKGNKPDGDGPNPRGKGNKGR